MVLHKHGQSSKALSLLTCMSPAEIEQGHAFLFPLSYCKQVSFHSIFSVTFFFVCLCHLLAISLFKMAQNNAEGLPSDRKHNKAVMCLVEKTRVLHGFVQAQIVVPPAVSAV